MSTKLACPHCGALRGFDVLEKWPEIPYRFSPTGRITQYDPAEDQRTYLITCRKCHQVVEDDQVAAEIFDQVSRVG